MELRNTPRNSYSYLKKHHNNGYVNIDIKILYYIHTTYYVPNFMKISQYLDPGNI
jgi:hypothetical protein